MNSRKIFNLPPDVLDMLIEIYTELLQRNKKASYTAVVCDAIRDYHHGKHWKRYEKEEE